MTIGGASAQCDTAGFRGISWCDSEALQLRLMVLGLLRDTLLYLLPCINHELDLACRVVLK